MELKRIPIKTSTDSLDPCSSRSGFGGFYILSIGYGDVVYRHSNESCSGEGYGNYGYAYRFNKRRGMGFGCGWKDGDLQPMGYGCAKYSGGKGFPYSFHKTQ